MHFCRNLMSRNANIKDKVNESDRFIVTSAIGLLLHKTLKTTKRPIGLIKMGCCLQTEMYYNFICRSRMRIKTRIILKHIRRFCVRYR